MAGLLGLGLVHWEAGRKPLAAGSDTPCLPLLPAETLSRPACSPAGWGICAPAGGEGLTSGAGLGEHGLFSLRGGLSVRERGSLRAWE